VADCLLWPHGFESPRSRATTLWYQQQTVRDNPDFAEVHNNFGFTLRQQRPQREFFKIGKAEEARDPASAKAKRARLAKFLREV
jgi:hypothetical protein